MTGDYWASELPAGKALDSSRDTKWTVNEAPGFIFSAGSNLQAPPPEAPPGRLDPGQVQAPQRALRRAHLVPSLR